MSESAIKANSSEAQRLYQRGMAAARAGQKRVAAGLLTRSVRLDPDNPMAWLWLSGVLDDPQQQAFCLRSVLALSPDNQHAQRGLRMLEQRGVLALDAPAANGGSLSVPAVAAPERRESWWVHFRHSRQEMSRARLLLWAFPILLLVMALALYESFALAVARSTELATPSALLADPAQATEPMPTARPTIEPILEAEPLAVVESLSANYLAATEPVLAKLRAATERYRQATNQTAGGSVGAVSATQRLRASVAAASAELDNLRPPATLQPAHADYLRGLSLQLDGLDAMLEFYASYDVANANRAAQRFQEARAYIERARNSFTAQAQQMAELSMMAPQTVR
ncbi:MAG: hypothetical protein AB4911_09280 [Oscillochloridaceae bacterium umkhey_bin13]